MDHRYLIGQEILEFVQHYLIACDHKLPDDFPTEWTTNICCWTCARQCALRVNLHPMPCLREGQEWLYVPASRPVFDSWR